jgi:hypothetical protein
MEDEFIHPANAIKKPPTPLAEDPAKVTMSPALKIPRAM